MNKLKGKKAFLGYAAVSLIVTAILCLTIMRPIFIEIDEQDIILSITATGQQAASSLGNAVRIAGITKNDQKVNLQEIDLSGKWVFEENMLECYGNEDPQKLDIPLKNVVSLQVDFVKQGGSGIVEISLKGKVDKLNLYSAEKEWETESWHYETEEHFAPFNRVDLLISIWILLTVIMLGVRHLICWKGYRKFEIPNIRK